MSDSDIQKQHIDEDEDSIEEHVTGQAPAPREQISQDILPDERPISSSDQNQQRQSSSSPPQVEDVVSPVSQSLEHKKESLPQEQEPSEDDRPVTVGEDNDVDPNEQHILDPDE